MARQGESITLRRRIIVECHDTASVIVASITRQHYHNRRIYGHGGVARSAIVYECYYYHVNTERQHGITLGGMVDG